jgi:hypothetical protein
MSQTPPMIPGMGGVGVSPAASPLTPEHLAQIARARELYRPIGRARRYAKFEAWTLMIFGMISFVGGFSSAPGMFVALALCLTGFFELKFSERLGRLDPDSPRLLAINQLALALSLVIYGCWQLLVLHFHPFSLAKMDPAVAGIGDTSDLDNLGDMIFSLVYYGLIVVALLWEGPTAYYFYTRRKPLHAYLAEVPEWARGLAQQTQSH